MFPCSANLSQELELEPPRSRNEKVNMHRPLHPSLIRIYSEASAESLYFDETYSTPQESFSQSFYFLTAVQLRHADLPAIRERRGKTAESLP